MWVRGEQRFTSNVPVMARLPDSNIDVVVVDVSATGCRLRTRSRDVQVGATILLEFEGIEEIAGQIAWSERRQFGVRFNRILPEATLDQIAL